MKSETEVARPVVEWLRAEGWEVYQEVSMGYADTTCDIVATSGSLLWAIEAKRSKTLALVDQARAWLGYANLVSVVTPFTQRRPTFRLRSASTWDWICDYWGIGQFEADRNGTTHSEVLRAALRHWLRMTMDQRRKALADLDGGRG